MEECGLFKRGSFEYGILLGMCMLNESGKHNWARLRSRQNLGYGLLFNEGPFGFGHRGRDLCPPTTLFGI